MAERTPVITITVQPIAILTPSLSQGCPSHVRKTPFMEYFIRLQRDWSRSIGTGASEVF